MRLIDADVLSRMCGNWYLEEGTEEGFIGCLEDLLNIQPTIKTEPEWIPLKARELTDEEKEEHPESSFIFDCQLPEDGQRILVSIDVAGHKYVYLDEFCDDDGIYLDSGYEIGAEAVAWMPLPKPYQEENR